MSVTLDLVRFQTALSGEIDQSVISTWLVTKIKRVRQLFTDVGAEKWTPPTE
jgi:hypothetical protein